MSKIVYILPYLHNIIAYELLMRLLLILKISLVYSHITPIIICVRI